MSKSDLRARPIFHHTRDAIEAHLTIVFTALAIARYLQDATGLSIKKIVHTLRPIQQIRVHIAGHEHLAEDPPHPSSSHHPRGPRPTASVTHPGGTSRVEKSAFTLKSKRILRDHVTDVVVVHRHLAGHNLRTL